MRWKWWSFATVCITLLLAACGQQPAPAASNPTSGSTALNPVFAECYRPEYGPVLSDTAQYLPNQSVQFTRNAVLLFDLKHPPSAGAPCLLAAGVALHLAEPPTLPEEGALYIEKTGHNVHPLLEEAFLQNREEWGDPIAEAFVDEFSLVQYFANVGVRLHLNGDNVELLPYGAWLLASLDPTLVDQMTLGSFPVPENVRLLQPLLGLALVPGNRVAVGQLVPFSNLVLRVVGEGRTGIRPLNIVEILIDEGRMVLPKTAPLYSNLVPSPHPMYPAPVFEPFDRFIAVNGGYDLIGYPLAPPHPFNQGVRQCFTNTCLYYDPSLVDGYRVIPLPVGRFYWEGLKDKTLDGLVSSSAGVTLKLALPPNVVPGQAMSVRAYLALLGEPAAERALRLTVLVDGRAVGEDLQAVTDENGLATFVVPPLEVKAGKAMEIQVCYDGLLGDEPVCVSDATIVWDMP